MSDANNEALVNLVCTDCHQPFKAEQHRSVCPSCIEERMADDDGDEPDEELEDMFDCALLPNGQCLKAGSEECDWECPHSHGEDYAGSEAYYKKHGK